MTGTSLASAADMALTRTHKVLTVLAAFLAWAAFDDLTTDNSTNFWPERVVLAICAAWFLFAAWRVIQARRRPRVRE